MKDVRESILLEASFLFHQSGIKNISVDKISSELRISKKTFYSYFEQKQDLVDAVLFYQEEFYLKKLEGILKNKNAIEFLILSLKEIRKRANCEPTLMWNDIKKYYPEVFKKHILIRQDFVKKLFETNLKRGVEEGFYRKDLDIILISILYSEHLKNIFNTLNKYSKKYSKKRLIDFFIDMIIHVIANEKGLQYVQENYKDVEENPIEMKKNENILNNYRLGSNGVFN